MKEKLFEQMLNELIFELNKKRIRIGTVECCTCGLLGASIASVANSAEFPMYKGSITINQGYNDDLMRTLDVSPNAIKNNGVVSSQVACQMAIGGLYKLDLNLCVAVVGDIKNGVVWLCSARQGDKTLNFRYKQLILEGTNSEKYNKIIEEGVEIALLHAEE